ncbi:MAG: metal-dependent hydrolase [Candidatus Aenigmarchaeota archaeon]|nr:metal-dependent hydrolase [Candidatus Aenigmarchaeota archaeon]
MSLPKWFVHDVMHFMVGLLVFLLLWIAEDPYNYHYKLRYLILTVFLGAFMPDIDHLIYLKIHRFKSFGEFIERNIKSDRLRRGFLVFHNIFFMSFLMSFIPIVYLINPLTSYFFLGFLAHLILDFMDDKLLINTVEHWKNIKKFLKNVA